MIELMVGLAVGLVVLLALSTIYLITVSASNATLSSVRLNQDLRSSMMIISSDLRRAGYWNQTINARSPFGAGTEQGLQLSECAPEGTNCTRLDYAFDRDRNGGIEPSELFGFRLREGAIQMRTPTNDASQEQWTTLVGGQNDPVQITNLTFTAVGDPGEDGQFLCRNISSGQETFSTCQPDASDAGAPGDTILQKRRIQILLQGELGDYRMTLTDTVRVRNDRRVTL